MKPQAKHQPPVLDEVGVIRQRGPVSAWVALAYPNLYAVGMANLGFQTAYRVFNQIPGVGCERIFLPADRAAQPLAIESRRSLTEFDLAAFSVSFETDYLNILTILEDSGLCLRSQSRRGDHPYIIAGGAACLMNPEPISAFMDCILIGEGEKLIPDFMAAFIESQGIAQRLERLSFLGRQVKGCYVPVLDWRNEKSRRRSPDYQPFSAQLPEKIQRVYGHDIESAPATSVVLTPDATFGKTCLVEVSRGCPHGCRFCAAGFIYRPPRFLSAERLMQWLKANVQHTDRIGLVGAAFSDLTDISDMCEQLNQLGLKISFSSLRADAVSLELTRIMANNQVKTATYAPEAGSQRLRNAINKGINESDILNACELMVSAGILNLKLYFMIGLPTETPDDIQAVISLCQKIKVSFLHASRRQKRMGNIIVNINPFIPKPWTPFQRCGLEPITQLKQKIAIIRAGLKTTPNLKIHAESPKHAYIQTLLSQGDAEIGELLTLVSHNKGNWPKSLKEFPLNTDDYVYRLKNEDEALPWDFIDSGISPAFLQREYQRALTALPSPPCRMRQDCQLCGVC